VIWKRATASRPRSARRRSHEARARRPAARRDAARARGADRHRLGKRSRHDHHGEREAAIGLYLAPWQDEHASDLDRPPGLYDVPLQTLDVQRFRRQADYDEAIRDYRRERLYRSR
jgi:hypothetical protein